MLDVTLYILEIIVSQRDSTVCTCKLSGNNFSDGGAEDEASGGVNHNKELQGASQRRL